MRSSSSATGATSPSANSRTVRRISSWSGERSKSIGRGILTRRAVLGWPRVSRASLDRSTSCTRGRTLPLRRRTARSARDLHLPLGAGPHPVIVLIHGGSWHSATARVVMRALAGDLLGAAGRCGTSSTGGSARAAAGRRPSPTSPPRSTASTALRPLARSDARRRARPLGRRPPRAVGGRTRERCRPVRRARSPDARACRVARGDLAGRRVRPRGRLSRCGAGAPCAR